MQLTGKSYPGAAACADRTEPELPGIVAWRSEPPSLSERCVGLSGSAENLQRDNVGPAPQPDSAGAYTKSEG